MSVRIRLAERTRRRPTSIAGKVVTGGSASDSERSRLALLFRAPPVALVEDKTTSREFSGRASGIQVNGSFGIPMWS